MSPGPTAPDALAVRAVAPERFAIGGRAPRFAARPHDRDELVEIVRAAGRDGLAIVPWGGGVSLAYERALERYDLAIDLGGLHRVVEYEPEDLTLTAECGVTLVTLRERLAARGQELPLEGAQPHRATLGGALAANTSGPRRMRFGAPRDRILGARFVLADGTLARTGGKVVKNVAGYGIHRMLCGSRGALAIFVDASLKLLPAPAERLAMIYALPWDVVSEAERWRPLARLEPSVLSVVSPALARGVGAVAALPGAERVTGDRAWVVIGLEDDAPRVTELHAMVARALGEPELETRGVEVEAIWQQLSDLEGTGDGARLTFTSADLHPAAAAKALASGESFIHHAACGRLHVSLDPSAVPHRVRELAEHGFVLVDGGGYPVENGTTNPSAADAMRSSIRKALDPASRFAFGARWEMGFF